MACPPQQRRQRAAELLEQFGLSADRKRRIGEYSKGMRQKLALARALFHDPPVLLLDEPTSAMDPESARLVRDAIHSLRSANRAIIICTHNLAEAEELADQIAIIRRGRIIASGTVEALKQRLLGAAGVRGAPGRAAGRAGWTLLPASVTLTGARRGLAALPHRRCPNGQPGGGRRRWCSAGCRCSAWRRCRAAWKRSTCRRSTPPTETEVSDVG